MTMKPDVDAGLRYVAQRIAGSLIPDLGSEYGAADAGLITILLQAAAEEYQRGAQARIADLEAMRVLLAEGARRVEDPGLAERLAGEARRTEDSLRITDLNASHDRCKALLIELHATVEEAARADAPWACDLDLAIWRFYEAYADRHAFAVELG